MQQIATDCNNYNGLQQTTSVPVLPLIQVTCSPLPRIQRTATDCNRLQQSQYYHVYNTNSLPCRTRNPLQPTATHCTRLQHTATVPYKFRPVENPLFINYKLAAAHSRVTAQQDTDFEAHFHHSIFGYLWVVFHEHFHRRLHRCCFLFCNMYVYINIVYIHINALYTYKFICIYFHAYIYIQIYMYRWMNCTSIFTVVLIVLIFIFYSNMYACIIIIYKHINAIYI